MSNNELYPRAFKFLSFLGYVNPASKSIAIYEVEDVDTHERLEFPVYQPKSDDRRTCHRRIGKVFTTTDDGGVVLWKSFVS